MTYVFGAGGNSAGANSATKEEPKEPKEDWGVLDPVEKMRYDRLRDAGWEDLRALTLALRRDVDWHDAVDLLQKAGSDTAYRILL